MIKMFKSILFAMMLTLTVFSSSHVLAESGVKKVAGPCVHLRTVESCVGYPTGECFWDYADQRCESRFGNEDKCSTYSYNMCQLNYRECFWDFDDQRCERRH